MSRHAAFYHPADCLYTISWPFGEDADVTGIKVQANADTWHVVQSVPSIAKASGRKTKEQATASGPRIANKAATSKAAEAKKACSTVKSSSKQQAARISARKTPSSSPVVEETLPIKAQRAAGRNSSQDDLSDIQGETL